MRPQTLIAWTLLAGCSAASGPPPGPQTSYYQNAAPVFARNCTSCHQSGGIAPFALTSYQDAVNYKDAVANAVRSQIMPPLPPQQEGCQPLDDFRNMSEDDRQTILDWVAGGAAEGNASKAAPLPNPPQSELGTPTDVFDSGLDYTSSYPGNDEYRCFVIDPKLTATANVIALNVRYSNPQIVHHAVIFAALPGTEAQVNQLDAADPLPGYECFGGAGFEGAATLAAEAPGAVPRSFPDHTGVPLPAGTRFVVQMHYNFNNGRGTDHFAVEMWRSPTPITRYPHGGRIVNFWFDIPAGAADVMAQATTPVVSAGLPPNEAQVKEGLIWEVFPHMHMIGRTIEIDVVHQDGSHTCLLNIPSWNFHWQGFYRLAQPLAVQAGDQLLLTCHWDNSPAHQPIVNGQPQTPREVRFGEGSLDEMCLAGVVLTDPR